jgi:hypothetical protein
MIKLYVQNVIPILKFFFRKKFKTIKIPMSKGFHPGVDDSPLCTEDDSTKYRSVINFLRGFDIAYNASALSRFNMLPRERHLKAVNRILSYLKIFPKERVIIDSSYHDLVM